MTRQTEVPTESWFEGQARYHDDVWLSVVIPMYNEGARIVATLADAVETLDGMDRASEIVLVDDGSTDGTASVVQAWLDAESEGPLRSVRLVRHPRNLGKGSAVRTGLGVSRGRWTLMMDADNAARVEEVGKLLDAAARTGAGLVAGSRAAPGAEVQSRASRRFSGTIFRGALSAMGLGLAQDTQCGFKLYRRDAAALIATRGQENGYIFDLEHLAIADRSGIGIAEVGIRWEHKDGGKVHVVRDGLKMLAEAWTLRRRLRGMRFDGAPGAEAQVEVKPVTRAMVGAD